MPYQIAGIDVHKKMLAVVVADVEGEGDFQFERHNPAELRALAAWLVEQQVDEVVMESTAQYWRPVWERWNCTGDRSARPATARAHSRGRSTSH
jgi:Transposase